MPVERRSISLSAADLLEAVDAYRQSAPELLPQGQVIGAGVERGAGGGVAVTVTVQTGDRPVATRLYAASVLEMTIRYCIARRIPLLRRAHKRVAVQDGLVTLLLEHDTRPEAALAGMKECRHAPCQAECQTSPDGCLY